MPTTKYHDTVKIKGSIWKLDLEITEKYYVHCACYLSSFQQITMIGRLFSFRFQYAPTSYFQDVSMTSKM